MGELINFEPTLKLNNEHNIDDPLCQFLNIEKEKFELLPPEQKIKLMEDNQNEFLELLLQHKLHAFNIEPNPILDNYLNSISVSHLDSCDCLKEFVNYFWDLELYHEFLDKQDRDEDDMSKDYRLDSRYVIEKIAKRDKSVVSYRIALDKAKKYIFNSKYHIPFCLYYYKELSSTVKMFGETYNLSLPKVQTILKSIISYQISLLETLKYQQERGMYDKTVDKYGNSREIVNSNEYYKLKLNERIIDAVKKLDEMIEGNKSINVNIDTKHTTIENLIDQMKTNIINIKGEDMNENENEK